ncbi:hypothetical protein Poly24_51330 [Rosistilla carotiformis]|uniref:FHA domain-containing protein n=1 Tax=Rosistilla carotiformis TaxID=2528017 RepID=A0A518K0T9_9BACT|nr:FHA domain-containing protein [Rosistilla carotiformis]QDV71397.1 hypothetical protein Poly24_51330 [Rosistilla carotiformis]
MSAPANTHKPTQNSGSDGPSTNDYVEFQVDRVGHPRRRLRLSGQSYTFGSGEGCSVRLEDPSLRKTHAILIRQQDRLLVRGYGIAILVNGIRVTEAWLEPQDNIQLGDYTLTLLQGVRNPGSPTTQPSRPPLPIAEAAHSPFAESARHFITSPRQTSDAQPLARNPRKDGAATSSRLSFADGMRLVSKSPVHFDAEDYFSRLTPLAPARQPSSDKPPALDPREAARLQRLEEMQAQSSQHAEAAIASSAASTHAVETLADKLDSLFEQLAVNTERQRSDALQQELESANAKHANQLEAFMLLTDRVSVLETAVDRANKEARQHREKHEQALLRIQQLETQLSEAIATHSARQASWEQETEGLRKSIDDLNDQLSSAQQHLSEQQKESLQWRKELDDAIAGADKSAAEHATAIAAHLKRQDELTAEHARVVEELALQHAEQNEALAAAHARSIEDLLAEQEQLKSQLAQELADHEQALEREQAEHQQGLAVHAEQNAAAAAKIAHLENELAEAVTKYKNHQQVWEAEAKELNATIEQISRQMAISETKYNEQRELADQLQNQLTDIESANAVAEGEVVDQTAELLQELQNAQDRLAALRIEQTARQSSWQLEREELEYKISHQAAELSQLSAQRSAVNPQDEATVANRLAARLQAEVNRLHQDAPLETPDAKLPFAEFTNDQEGNGSEAFALLADGEALTAEDSLPQGLDDAAPSTQQAAETFSTPSKQEPDAADAASLEDEPAAESFDSEAISADDAEVQTIASADAHVDDEEPSSVFAFPQEEHAATDAEVSIEETPAEPLEAPPQHSVYHNLTDPNTNPDDPSALQVEDQEMAWGTGAENENADDDDDEPIANTYVIENPQQLDIPASGLPAFGEAFGFPPQAAAQPDDDAPFGEDASSVANATEGEGSFGSYDEAGWEDDAGELVIDSSTDDEVSPWGDDDDDALSGLAAEMIGEFNQDAPQAGSFANLSESSTYDPTAMDLNMSMSMGVSFPNSSDAPESSDADEHGPGPVISQAFPSIPEAREIDKADSGIDADDFAGHTQMMPAGGYVVSPPEDHLAQDAVDAERETYDPPHSEAPVEPDDVMVDSAAELAPPPEPAEEEASYYGSQAIDEPYDEAPAEEPVQKSDLPRREVPLYEPPSESAASGSVAETPSEDEEDSIEAYMNRLLNRMHGKNDEPEPAAPSRPEPTAAPVVSQPTVESLVEATVVEEAKQDVMHESEYVPRSAAPEHTANLTAMRELANSSARQAIAKSVRNRQRSQSMLKLFLSGAFIMGSGTFAVLAQRQLMPYALASAACVLLAIYWGLSGLKLLKGSGTPSSERSQPPAKEPSDTAANRDAPAGGDRS